MPKARIMSASEIHPPSIFPLCMHAPIQLAGLGLLKRAGLVTHSSDGSVPLGARKSVFFLTSGMDHGLAIASSQGAQRPLWRVLGQHQVSLHTGGWSRWGGG